MTAPSIFVIDDQEAVRNALGEMLRVFGHRVQTYDSADGFLQSFSSACTGCIVADVRMPVAAIKAGAEDFIEKPVDDTHLLAAINRCLARSFDNLLRERTIEELRARMGRLTPREAEVMDL